MNVITSQCEIKHKCMSINHVHMICPFNYCSCICYICNCCCGCQCKCHKLNQKATRNNISKNNYNDISTKTPLSNYSKDLYKKESFQNSDDGHNNSPDKYNNKRINKENSKRLIHSRLNKNPVNQNNKYCGHSRSLSDVSYSGNSFGHDNYKYLPERNRYFNRSYMNNFYKNKKNNFNSSTDRESKLAKKRLYDYNDNYINIRGERSEEKNMRNIDGSFLNYDYSQKKTIDLKNSKNEDNNNNNLNNYNIKRNKYKSYLNSCEKKSKVMDNLNNKKRKDVYINLDPSQNLRYHKYEHSIDNNSRHSSFGRDDLGDEIKREKTSHKDGIIKDYNTSRPMNYKYYRQIQYLNKKKNNKNNDILDNNNNKYDDIDNNKKIKDKNYDLNNHRDYNNIYNYNKSNDLENNLDIYNKYKNNVKNNYFKIYSFSFSINCFNYNKLNSLNDKDEINNLKNQLIEKNNEILDYKTTIDLLKNELEFYKNQVTKLKQNNTNNKKIESNFIYRRKSKDEIKANLNDNNGYKKDHNYLKNKIYEEYNNFQINSNKKDENSQIKNKNNKNERQIGLSSKLNVKTDLNVTKDNEYKLSNFNKSNVSDKCIYAISSLTKSKSILCFDFQDKTFSYRDYADFGDFQENYLSSFENLNENSKNNSIFLVIKYNFYIVTGENCDMLYVYNSLKRTIYKLCSLKNNHSNGALINYSDEILCISGNFNKKVELYNQSKNEWTNLPELKTERSNFATCIIKNKYLFCLFGYNLPTKQYLNTIEYLDIENYKNSSWKYLKYKNENLLSLYITGGLGINYNDEKIIIAGGDNGMENKPNEYFYQIILSENFEKDKETYVEKTNRKLKDIYKNKCYLFNKGYNIILYNNNLFYMAFDDKLRAHLFQTNNMAHDIFNFD